VSDHWIEGQFEGTYTGKRLAGASARGGPRRFSFRLQSGQVLDAGVVAGPFPDDPSSDEVDEIRQDRVGRIRLSVPRLELDHDETSLFDVRIVDWRLSRPAEANGRSHGRIEGTIRARLTPPQPEPSLEQLPDDDANAPAVEPPSPPPAEARAPEPRRRLHDDAHPSLRSAEVEALDAETIYDRLRWLAATLVVLGVGAGLWRWCGAGMAATWLAAIGTALCLRRVARGAIRAGSPAQGLFAGALVTAQAALWLEPMARGASLGCITPTSAQLAGLGGAVVAAGLLRGRVALGVTSVVWTAAICSWCAALGGGCTMPAVAPAAMPGPQPAEHRPAPRTSPDGHWPVMPGRRHGGGGGDMSAPDFAGAAGAGASSPSVSPGGGGAFPRIEGSPGGVDSAASGDGGGAIGAFDGGAAPASTMSGGSTSGATSPPTAGDVARVEDARAASTPPAEPVTSRRGGSASTRGGWVAEDHRRASAGAELISIEHANRVPDAFFGGDGMRRVYVPTDPIFEPGGADIRATGALQLGRIAALLDLHPDRRTMLVVHTDVGGGLDAQQRLSERRAASVRGWLVDRGHVDADRFDVLGAGGAHPLVPPDGSYAAQQPNRRIEISLIE